jgi:hypothetical protein
VKLGGMRTRSSSLAGAAAGSTGGGEGWGALSGRCSLMRMARKCRARQGGGEAWSPGEKLGATVGEWVGGASGHA